ncbi:MAG: YlbF family regulator [Oscillospiraceae bacterium]|nr:YlbF family regulator [Oscillospiraceae bacterium]
MTIIDKARELGAMLQQDERYAEYYAAKAQNDKDENLQNMINEFNMKRMQLNNEMSKEQRDEDKLNELDDAIKSLYGTIMANENMERYNKAKTAMDSLLNQINMVITYSANGEDPMTCPCDEVSVNCSGSCSTCGGCH